MASKPADETHSLNNLLTNLQKRMMYASYSNNAAAATTTRRRQVLGGGEAGGGVPPIASSFQQHHIRDPREMVQVLIREEDPEDEPDVVVESGSPLVVANKSSSVGGGGGGLNRTKSLFSMPSNLSFSTVEETSSLESSAFELQAEQSAEFSSSDLPSPDTFILDMRLFTGSNPNAPSFNSSELRKIMEPHLRRARLLRENSRRTSHLNVDASIASSIGVPYTALRQERPFIFDEHAYPLHTILASTLNIPDLSQAHLVDEDDELLRPLLDRDQRHAFHTAYDTFVTSFCIPLLHSMAISKQMFQHYSMSDRVTYRYQAFPTIRISRPGSSPAQDEAHSSSSSSSPVVCDTIRGHSIGCLTFHVPLTPCQGTNSLFTESHPGKEDWHPLEAKSGVGLGYLFDGARCLQFDLENTTPVTGVALTFRVLMYREEGSGGGGCFCPPELREDAFSKAGPGYYDEAVIDLRSIATKRLQAVMKKRGSRGLLEPDHRVGYPFLS